MHKERNKNMDNSVFFVNNEDGATFKMMTRKPIFSN